MKDLYKPLGLSGPESSEADVRRALKNPVLDHDAAHHATAILLNSQRRAAYDRTWRTLTTIGALRANLGVDRVGHWGSDYADFNPARQPKGTLRKRGVGWARAGKALALVAFAGYCVFETLSVTPTSQAVDWSQFTPVENTPSGEEDLTPLTRIQICELQERLGLLGYYAAPVDGIHGPKSQEAVVSYRRSRNSSPGTDATLGLLNNLLRTYTVDSHNPYQPMPNNGSIFEDAGAPTIAPFEVKTSAARRGYLVKVKTVGQSQGQEHVIKSFFVAGGSTFLTKLPLGLYQVHYAAGDNWLSYPCAFGKDTIFSRAEATFEFSVEFGRVKGYTVDLIPQLNGNLRTTQIDAKEF